MPTTASKRLTSFSSVRASLLAAIVARFEKQDRSALPLLKGVGISPEQLADPYGSIPLPQFVAFLEGAAPAIGDPSLGARVGSTLAAGDMGPAGIVLSLSASIDGGLARFARYTNAVQSGTAASWISDDDRSIFSYQLDDDSIWPRRQDAEFSLVSLMQVLRDNFNRRLSPIEVHFEHAGNDDETFMQRFFNCSIQYSQTINRLVLSRDDCERVLRREDRDLLYTLEKHILDMIDTKRPATSASNAARRAIEAQLGLTPITLERTAATLSMNPRSLQRRLSQEGTSVRQLLEECRRARAKRLLSEPGARIGEIALALGYSDTTAFWRAYRGWTGSAPSSERNLAFNSHEFSGS